jgi:hypothetical protein
MMLRDDEHPAFRAIGIRSSGRRASAWLILAFPAILVWWFAWARFDKRCPRV